MDEVAVGHVREFLRRVRGDYDIMCVYLFGSRARGDYLKESDLDILMVSDDFEGVRFPDRAAEMLRYWDLEWGDPEFLCYTEDEFQDMKGRISIVRSAVDEGVPVEA